MGFAWLFWRYSDQSVAGQLSSRIEEWLARPGFFSILFYSTLFTYILGIVILASLIKIQGAPFYSFILQIIPYILWMTGMSVLVLFALVLSRQNQGFLSLLALALLLGLLVAGVWFHVNLWGVEENPQYEDTYSVFREGRRLLEGKNPYDRILGRDLSENANYAAYLPVSYLLSLISQIAGLDFFWEWLLFWRMVFLFFNLAIATSLFLIPARQKLTLYAAFAMLFWFFNRWTLLVTKSSDFDFIPIFFLILSLTLFPSYKLFSLLCFGFSLGWKHLAIFLLPLYLLWTWRASTSQPARQVVIAGLTISVIPFVVSLPFVAWNWQGFLLSILISITRNPTARFDALSLDALMGWTGWPARVILLGMVVFIYVLSWKEKVSYYLAAFLLLLTVADFNTVLFSSYFDWVVPFLLLIVFELLLLLKERIDSPVGRIGPARNP